ncbi:phosphoribosylformylglycinamidine synthase subunit PurQ [Lederbergia galactosidilytica]|uniref:Phosphoribosylformylglycinamidine synthase subunit PurQ n=1 Tax=Lederbergia galactosidilytica TaxID=217031 RepID=A0A177ZT19_9BACI|nr:phosphoribosylformylglycinamidine synthase subunit PurQ [Lederbergia galactosidilytica]OAK70944.1 phosphoribosylformylglycinamidine synthase [Lederbergia galactosidilytica]
MKVAIVVFPGTSCGEEMYTVCSNQLKLEAVYVRENEANLDDYDAILLPGGASYGDAIRPGAIAALQPVMSAIKRTVEAGKPVLGIGNGFQILTEAGLLPGVLLKNDRLKFKCVPMKLVVQNNETFWSKNYEQNEKISIPIAHGYGRYHCDSETLQSLKDNRQIIFTYAEENPNGSTESIAGISNQAGNVVGMMPHPERAVEEILGSVDGIKLFQALKIKA